jgi:hypothetical protein
MSDDNHELLDALESLGADIRDLTEAISSAVPTRRERIATAALTGMLANDALRDVANPDIARMALEYAGDLIAALDEQP